MQDRVLQVVGYVEQVRHPHWVYQPHDVLETWYIARQGHMEEPEQVCYIKRYNDNDTIFCSDEAVITFTHSRKVKQP